MISHHKILINGVGRDYILQILHILFIGRPTGVLGLKKNQLKTKL